MFIYDISNGAPVLKQVVTVPNSYNGIAFDPLQPLNNAFYVSSGVGDYPYDNNGGLDHPLTLAVTMSTSLLWAPTAQLGGSKNPSFS